MEMNYNNELRINPDIVQNKIHNGYKFDIGRYLNDGWEIFKKEWLTFSIYSLLLFLIIMLAAMTIIGILFVAYPLMLGYFIGAHRVKTGQSLSIGDMFGGFKKIPQLALLTLIPVLAVLIFNIPFVATGAFSFPDGPPEAAPAAMMLMYPVMFAVGLAINLALFYAPYLILFGDYSVSDAIKTSWSLALKQPLMIVLYIILVGFIAQFGVFLCFIGVFVSMSFAYVCYYPAIKDVLFTDTNLKTEIDY